MAVREVPSPVIKEGQERVRVTRAGAGQDEVSAFKGQGRYLRYPLIPGRALGGIIAEGARAGARVVVDPWTPGASPRLLGLNCDGGLCEEIAVPSAQIHEVPDALPDEFLPLVDPLTRALGCVRRAVMAEGEVLVIFGANAVGLMVALLANYYRALPLIVDTEVRRIERARALGIERCVLEPGESPVERVREMTEGRLALSVAECSGSESSAARALEVAAPGGRIALMHQTNSDGVFPAALICERLLEVGGAKYAEKDFPTAINLISSRALELDGLADPPVSLEEVPEALRAMAERPGERVMLTAEL